MTHKQSFKEKNIFPIFVECTRFIYNEDDETVIVVIMWHLVYQQYVSGCQKKWERELKMII